RTLVAGNATVILSRSKRSSGLGLQEAYHRKPRDRLPAPLLHVARRGRDGAGGAVLVAGLIVRGGRSGARGGARRRRPGEPPHPSDRSVANKNHLWVRR